jgi:hypothetical protein
MAATDEIRIRGLVADNDGPVPRLAGLDFGPLTGEARIAAPADGTFPMTIVVLGQASVSGVLHVSPRGTNLVCDIVVAGHSGGFVARVDSGRLLLDRSTDNASGLTFTYPSASMMWPLAVRQGMEWELNGTGAGRSGTNHRLEVHSRRRVVGATPCLVNAGADVGVVVEGLDEVRDFSRSTDTSISTREVVLASTGLPVLRLIGGGG